MIKQLRLKFVCMTMALVTVMLVMMLGTVYRSTAESLENAANNAMQTAAMGTVRPGRPGEPNIHTGLPCFTLEQNLQGDLWARGDFFDLSDSRLLEQIYGAAERESADSGVLAEFSLRYLRLDTKVGRRYVFADMSSELQTLKQLVQNCVLVGIAGFFAFLGISILLARWAVRPVEKAWQQQRQFVADASHELKTPLTVILTNAELLQSRDYDEQERTRFATSILDVARQMRGLVENLLDLARLEKEGARIASEPTDLSGLLEETVLPFEPLYYERGLELQTQIAPGVTVNAVAPQLRQVAEILLDNGCKYAKPGTTVTVTLEKTGRTCRLRVESEGAQLTAQQCRDIFKRFYRADAARTGGNGYGLGLSIALRLVEDHRGKIWAESQNGVNTFFVVLPALGS